MTPDPTPDTSAPHPLAPLLAPKLGQRGIFRWFFFGVFAFLIWQLALILSLFSDVIIWAVSLTLVFAPFHRFVAKRLPGRRNTVAAIATVGVLLLVLVPLTLLFGTVVKQSAELVPTVNAWLGEAHASGRSVSDMLPGFVQDWWNVARGWIEQNPYVTPADLEDFMVSKAESISLSIADFGTAAARGVLLLFINLSLILALMYFCFRDGERFLHWLYQIVPMSSQHVEEVALRIYQTINAVISGALLTAGTQGLLALIGYAVAGVPLAVFFGVLTGISAMIPVVGAALVWVPLSIFVFLDSPGWGLLLAGWGFFVVSLIDNFMKPILIGSQARMPILLVFCAILGGLNVYGFTGIIIGPILIAMLLAFVGIYRDYYLPGHDSHAQESQRDKPGQD